MSSEQQVSRIGVHEVRQALDALYEDFGICARVVVFVRRDAIAPATLSVVAQPVTAAGAPTMVEQEVRQVWPNNQFRTFTAACHFTLWLLYQRVERELERVRTEAAEQAP